jgi:hypothetical protein
MYAKLRLNGSQNAFTVNDAILALFDAQATTLTAWYNAMLPATQPYVNLANSYIDVSKSTCGWAVDYSSSTSNNRTALLKAPCANSVKFKYASIIPGTSNILLNTGTNRVGNALVDSINVSSEVYFNSVVPAGSVMDIHISSSPRHLFIGVTRIDTGASLCSAVFEHVTNDGYFSETSPYCPVVLAARMDLASNYVSGTRTFKSPRYKNLRAANYPDVTAQQMYWETPYSDDDFNPADNGGYDFIGTGTDRTPLLIPFGVCNRSLHAFVGGAISDLCDVYLGPTNVGGNFQETLIGADTYMSFPINEGTKRLFLPKG